jgi:hypothetical protein
VGPSCQGEGAVREGGSRVADWWGRTVSAGAGARSWAAWAGERGGGGKERERAARVGPNSAQPRGVSFFFFLFLISISFLFLFYFCFFFL